MDVHQLNAANSPDAGTVQWLKGRVPGGSHWTEGAIQAVTAFALTWHLFEGNHFSDAHRMDVWKLHKLASDLNSDALTRAAKLSMPEWRRRYGALDVPRLKLSLGFEGGRVEKELLPVLSAVLSTTHAGHPPADLRLTGLLISYRLRNNLFHGGALKPLTKLNEQESNLRSAAAFLAAYLPAA